MWGGILKHIEGDDITLIHYDLRFIGNEYNGHSMKLPSWIERKAEVYVLVSLLYPYQYEEVKGKLVSGGYKENQIIHVRDLSEQLLDIHAEYYAQNKMDLKVKELFDSIGKDISTIKYIDIGSNNYSLYNNTYLFYKNGATGVLVEANPDFSEMLKKNRPKDMVLSAGCAAYTVESLKYYKTNRAGYNTFAENRLNIFDKKGITVTEILSIPVYGINEILEKYFKDGHIDYMSIDIEGMDEEVLLALDFHKFSVDIILCEIEYDTDLSRKLFCKLIDMGYEVKWRGIGTAKDFLCYKKEIFQNNIGKINKE